MTMNRDVDELKEIIKGQTGNAELRAQQQPEQLETVVTIGLVSIAIDSFCLYDRSHRSESTQHKGRSVCR